MRLFNRRPRRQRSPQPQPLMETLEQRLAMYQGPFVNMLPGVSLQENANNSLVRVVTNVGFFDIELFDETAPQTVANFKNYIKSGRYDESFFHRLLPGGILQGGGYKFRDGSGLSSITLDPPIINEAQRPNVARTIAMATVTGSPNSATSQFFINIVDNPSFNGQYAVFGKIIQGWSTITTINGFFRRDLDQQFTGSNPTPGVFDNVPTTNDYNPVVGPTENTLVKIIDIEMLRDYRLRKQYEQEWFYPEGFRNASVNAQLNLLNPDQSLPTHYQVIVRYESGERDEVIFSGGLAPNQRQTLRLTNPADPNYNVVRPNVGYALIVRSTRALSVALNHRDAGGLISETFNMTARISPGDLKQWTLHGEKGTGKQSFLVYQNLTDAAVTLNMVLYPESGPTRFFNVTVAAFRRGGLAFHDIGTIPSGAFTLRILASQPIGAAISQYDFAGTPGVDSQSGSGSMGSGGYIGALAGAIIPTGAESTVRLDVGYVAPNVSVAVLDFYFYLNNGTVLTKEGVLLTSANRRDTFTLSSMHPSLPRDQYFSIRYVVRQNAAPVAVTYRAKVANDVLATPFQTQATRDLSFADGYTDPSIGNAGMQEHVSVFNPYSSNVNFFFQIFYHFADGTTLVHNQNPTLLNPRERMDIRTSDVAAVVAKINANPGNRFYSIQVKTAQFVPLILNGGVIAQVTRRHDTWNMAMTSGPVFDNRLALSPLTAAEFN